MYWDTAAITVRLQKKVSFMSYFFRLSFFCSLAFCVGLNKSQSCEFRKSYYSPKRLWKCEILQHAQQKWNTAAGVFIHRKINKCLQCCRCTKLVSWRASAVKGYLILRKFAYIEVFTLIMCKWDRDFNWTIAGQWNPSMLVVTICYVPGYVRDFFF